MDILITGNCGYVGSIMTDLFLKEGHKVIGYDILMHGKEHMIHFEDNENYEFHKGDTRDFDKIEPLIEKSDVVVHLAAIPRVDDCLDIEPEMYEINSNASIEIARLCLKHDKKIVFASTCSVYGMLEDDNEITEESEANPTTIYAKTKAEAELGIQRLCPDALICRFATAYGFSPRMRYDLFINEVTRDAYVKKKIELFDPKVWRCFINTKDMARGVLFLL
ncbi:hypothetical protein CMI45_00605, partial [Candidatus Pacearchaeota archaeon]|nr:hypothetical protein [Candidatus Pacearchaeota archaeon]